MSGIETNGQDSRLCIIMTDYSKGPFLIAYHGASMQRTQLTNGTMDCGTLTRLERLTTNGISSQLESIGYGALFSLHGQRAAEQQGK